MLHAEYFSVLFAGTGVRERCCSAADSAWLDASKKDQLVIFTPAIGSLDQGDSGIGHPSRLSPIIHGEIGDKLLDVHAALVTGSSWGTAREEQDTCLYS